MKKIFYCLFAVLFAFSFSRIHAQTSHKIAIQFFAQATNLGAVSIYSDTISEGQVYTIKPATLTGNYAVAQGLYNALVGSEFYFQQGSLNQNISLIFDISDIDLTNGTYDPDFGANFFFNVNFAVYDFSGNLQPEPFNLNSGTYAVLRLNKSADFNSFISKTGIDINAALKFVYEVSSGFDLTGIQTFDSTSSITAEISHFSHIVGSTQSSVTGVESQPAANNTPTNFELKQNYPNPFNPSTNIEYDLPARSFVQLDVYNILGVKVASLVNGIRSAGAHNVTFSPDNLSSGLYIYQLKAKGLTISRKMLYMK